MNELNLDRPYHQGFSLQSKCGFHDFQYWNVRCGKSCLLGQMPASNESQYFKDDFTKAQNTLKTTSPKPNLRTGLFASRKSISKSFLS